MNEKATRPSSPQNPCSEASDPKIIASTPITVGQPSGGASGTKPPAWVGGLRATAGPEVATCLELYDGADPTPDTLAVAVEFAPAL